MKTQEQKIDDLGAKLGALYVRYYEATEAREDFQARYWEARIAATKRAIVAAIRFEVEVKL